MESQRDTKLQDRYHSLAEPLSLNPSNPPWQKHEANSPFSWPFEASKLPKVKAALLSMIASLEKKVLAIGYAFMEARAIAPINWKSFFPICIGFEKASIVSDPGEGLQDVIYFSNTSDSSLLSIAS
ncbi:hypothetical protein L7F22_041050 [Adiantum nelumboides]|nr:hypothetical protein [Adiantum nelumboides]